MYARSQLTAVVITILLSLASIIHAEPPQRAAPQRVPLKYRLSNKPTEEVWWTYQHAEKLDQLDKVEPREWKSADPAFGTVPLGTPAEDFYFAADRSNAAPDAAGGHDVIYFDFNRDGRFDDTEAVQANPRLPDALVNATLFGPFRVDVASGKRTDGTIERSAQWFTLRLVYQETMVRSGQVSSGEGLVRPAGKPGEAVQSARKGTVKGISIVNMGYYVGRVRFGDTKMLVGVVDSNGDGVYSTASYSRFESEEGDDELEPVEDAEGAARRPFVASKLDQFLIDRNGNGLFDNRQASEGEQLLLGRTVLVGGRYYTLDVAPDGTSLAVSPSDEPTGMVEWSGELTQLELAEVRDKARQMPALQIATDANPVPVPAGHYRVTRLDYTYIDDEGKPWRFWRWGWGKSSPTLDVAPGGRAKLSVGLPLEARVIVAQPAAASRTLTLTVEIKGAGDVQFAPAPEHYKNLSAPQIRITHPNGNNELVFLDLARNAAGQWAAVWRIPDTVQGELRAAAVLTKWKVPSECKPTDFRLDKEGRLLPMDAEQ